MAISVRDEGSKVNSNINVTPMVDVMLVLLIIFMVITPMLQNKVNVDLAKTDHPTSMPDADKEDAIVVAVTRDGTVYLGQTRSLRPNWAARFATSSPTSRASRSSSGPMRAPNFWTWKTPLTMSARRALSPWAC